MKIYQTNSQKSIVDSPRKVLMTKMKTNGNNFLKVTGMMKKAILYDFSIKYIMIIAY